MEFSFSKCLPPKDGLLKDECNTPINPFVQLYVYEWTLSDFKFLKGLGLSSLASPTISINETSLLQIQLLSLPSTNNWCTKNNNSTLKVSLHPSKSKRSLFRPTNFNHNVWANAQQLIKNYAIPLEFQVCDIKLEFLNSSRKILDHVLLVPTFESETQKQFFTCEIEDDLSKFVEQDVLKLQLKLTLKYQGCINKEEYQTARNAVHLSSDMEKLSQNGICADLDIKVDEQQFSVHKCILLPQFKFVLKLVSELENISSVKQEINSSAENGAAIKAVSIPNEKAEIFKVIIQYIYSGRISIGNKISYFDLYNFAQKYQLIELCTHLKPVEMHIQSKVQRTISKFYWRVTEVGIKSLEKFILYESPEFKTSIATSWRIAIYFHTDDSLSLSLKLASGDDSNHFTYFRLILCYPDGAHFEERELHHNFVCGSPIYPGFLNPESRFSVSPDLVFDGMLCVGCEITVCDELLTCVTSNVIPEGPQDFIFKRWQKNLQGILENGDFSDVTISAGDTDFKVHRAILSARSPVFATMFNIDMAEKLNNSVQIKDISCSTMRCALRFIYTGLLDVLTMNEAAELYRTADKYEMLPLKEKCAEFMTENLDPEHACEVLILSDLFGEESVKKLAMDMICRNASLTLLTEYGQELMVNHPELSTNIFNRLSAAYCSVGPQEISTTLCVKPQASFSNPFVKPLDFGSAAKSPFFLS